MRARATPLWACAAVSAAALSTTTAPARAALPPSVLSVLHEVWEQTGGPQGFWTGPCAVGWGVGDPCDPSTQWNASGCVVCNDAGNDVTELWLNQSNLTGPIPPSLGNLAALTCLSLNNNRLTAAIPLSLGRLTALTTLSLGSNQLTGTIPSSLGNLTAVVVLLLSSNKLTGTIPLSIGNLTALQILLLFSNQLTGAIPSSLGSLTALNVLSFFSNQLTGEIPHWLGNLTALTQLFLGQNKLTGTIPSSLGNLISLTKLGLGSNPLTGTIPASLGGLTALTSLSLSNNHLTGIIPSSISNLTALTVLYLNLNQLTGTITSWLGNLTMLTQLDLNNNQLTGTIPPSLGNLTALTYLGLGTNQLTGMIPSSFGNLTALTYLSLGTNQLTGIIPSWLSNLTALTNLGLCSNQLTGTIPSSLGNLTRLTELFLCSNRLAGTVPPSLGKLTALTELGLQSNQLTGTIPSSFGNLTALTALGLFSNQLTGTIPSWIGNLTSLTYIGLFSNQLTGTIPTSLGNLHSLANLTISDNTGLSGSFPRWICNLTQLQALILERTAISGSLPSCLHRLSQLQELDLRGLHLIGALPSSLFLLPQLQYLLASGADFSTGLPQFDCNRTSCATSGTTAVAQGSVGAAVGPHLRMLALVACGLSGEIPSWVGRLPSIISIDLSGNDLSGPIPTFVAGTPLTQFAAANNRLAGTLEALQNATLLNRLNVHSNEVGGVLGDWLGNMSGQMTELVVTENYLSCELPPTTRIKARDGASSGDEDPGLNVLSGNVFSCPVPAEVEDNDSGANDYVCGSSDLTFAGAFFGVAVAVAAAVAGGLSSTVIDANEPPTGTGAPVAASDTPERLLTWLLVVTAVLFAVAVLPVYSTSRAVLECRYGWSTTAAFLAPGVWSAVVTVVGGLVGGGLVACSLVAIGNAGGVVRVHDAQGSMSVWNVARALLIYAVVLCLLVLLNAAFVLLEESPHASGSAKHATVVVFAVLHEVIDHAVTPVIVSVIVVAAVDRGRSVTPRAERIQGAQVLVTVAAVAVELANSVVAPVIAQLGVSEGCYRNALFGSDDTITTTAQVPYCTGGGGQTNRTFCAFNGFEWAEYTIFVTYTPPFRFDSWRCISSIITLYTPEYLVIFALRVLVYPAAWLLARRGTPWIVAGLQPPVWLQAAFVETRRRVISVMECCAEPGCAKGLKTVRPPTESEVFPGGVEFTPALGLSRGDGVLEALHATEPTTHVFNLLAIAMCPGMFSPVVAVAAVGCVVFKHLWEWCLDRRAAAQSDAATQTQHVQHATHALPVMCVAMLLLLHSVYLVVLLSTAESEWARWTAVGVNWAAFGATCWLCGGVGGAAGDKGEGQSDALSDKTRNVSNHSFELTERLLPAKGADGDSDE